MEKICDKSCFHYEHRDKGCSYTSPGFEGLEPIEPGQPCLHPEFDKNEIIEIPLSALEAFF